MRFVGRSLVSLAVLLAAACGSNDEPQGSANSAPPTETPAASATPLPSVDMADLTPGATYTTRQFKPNITFTVPEGEWKLFGADSPDHIEIEPADPQDPVDAAALSFRHISRVFHPKTGGEIPGDAVAAPEDFAQWLTEHPHLRTTKPKPVKALGLPGVSIDVRVKSSQPRQYRDCGKVEGDCVVMFIGAIEPVVMGSTSIARFYVLEQPDGKELVVEQYVDPASALKVQGAALGTPLLESATTAGG